MVGQSPRCYIPSFIEVGPPVPEKILKVFTIYEHGGYFGHVAWTIYTRRSESSNNCLVIQLIFIVKQNETYLI